MWCFEAEAVSGAVVEAMHGKSGVLSSDRVETHLLREELSDEAVHVLVGAAFPRGIGMSEEELCIELPGDPLMLGELLAVIGRQRVNAGGKRREQRDHGIGDRLCGLERHMGDQRVTGLAFVERDERLMLTGADDQITLPVIEVFAADDCRALLDRHMVSDGAASLATPIALPEYLLTAQGPMQGGKCAGRWLRG